MKSYKIKLLLGLVLICTIGLSCKKDDKVEGQIADAVYITSTAVTGTGANASTTITNSATGRVSAGTAPARVYVNTPKNLDVTVTYTLAGTAVSGTNYTAPNPLSLIIPAGNWYADIQIPVLNTPLPANRTIIITLATASNNTQIGLGTDRNYKVFTYTLTN